MSYDALENRASPAELEERVGELLTDRLSQRLIEFEEAWELEPSELAARYVAVLPPDTTVTVRL